MEDCGDNEEISEDGLSCVSAVCTAENYPLPGGYNGCPDHGNCKQCVDASGTYRKRLVSCDTGYEMNAEKTKCYPICSAAEYPFSECPDHARCNECTGLNGVTLKNIKSCDMNYQLSADGKSCEAIAPEQCTAELFPFSECPNTAICSECSEGGDEMGERHYKITGCRKGYELNDDGLSCIKENPYELECNTTNFPLTSCPYPFLCSDCTIGKYIKYYRIKSCQPNFKYDPDKETCTKIQTDECTADEYPLAKCADNMDCVSCEDVYGVEHNKFVSCNKGFKLSEDSLSCIRDENFKCDTSYYNIYKYAPGDADSSHCTDITGTYYHINQCHTGTKLNEDGTACLKDENAALECNNVNYPFDTLDELFATTHGAAYYYEGCVKDGHYIWRLTSCIEGYQINETATNCIPSGNCNEIYFPITSGCPHTAKCSDCISPYGVLRWQIDWCSDGTHLSDDKTDCIEGCDLELYNLSSCPDGADCSPCSDSNGTHYRFNKCRVGFVQTNGENCVAQELRPRDSDVVNDNDISVSSVSDKTTVTVATKIYPNEDTTVDKTTVTVATKIYPNEDTTVDKTFNIAFNNKDQPKGNLYNAQNKDASITVDSSSGVTYGLGSVSDASADVINAYGGHTGTIKMNHGGGTGIIGRGNIYNAYKGSTGIIEITNSENPKGSIQGIYSWGNFDSNNKSIINAFGGDSIGKIILNHTITAKNSTVGIMSDTDVNFVINAYNGGTGSIEITSKASGSFGAYGNTAIGIWIRDFGTIYNAYSDDGSTTKGEIIINADEAEGLHAYKEAHNAYGKGAEGRIICNGSCTAINGNQGVASTASNGLNGGHGYIEINVDKDNGKAEGILATAGGNGIGKDSHGEIVINMKGKDGYVMGCSVNNGSLDGGIGTITINDTGGNNIRGIEGGNFKGSSINITSVANNDKAIIGILAVNRDPYNPPSFPGQNYGDINIKSTGSAIIMGIRETVQSGSGFKNDEPYSGNYDKLNEGTIFINRDYTADNAEGSPDTPTSETYGMISGNLTNKGIIKIEGPKTLGTNQYDYSYGLYNKRDNKVLLNYGTIDVSGGYKHYAMYNDTQQSTSFNYGTAIGDLYNVNNAVGGKLYGKFIGNMVEKLDNGDADNIATSADDQDKGYIEYTLSGDDTAVIYGKDAYYNKCTFTNYGVVNAYNDVENGTAWLADTYNPTNYGYIKITNKKDGATFSAMASTIKASVRNHGTLEVNAGDTNNTKIYGISAKTVENSNNYRFYNTGHIKIDMGNSANSTAYGIYSEDEKADIGTEKDSDITITSTNNGTAYGIYADNAYIQNKGNITLTGVNPDTSYGIYAVNESTVYNSGTISINGASYSDNAASGHFIYIDESSKFNNSGDLSFQSVFDTAALGGGKFVLGKDGKITAPEIKGDITADAGITSGGFDKTYSNKNAFSGKTDEVKLNSGSALFDATLKDNDIVMTMKDFDEVVDDKSLAAYLQRNYEAKRNEQLFNSLKFHATSASLNNSLNQQLGFSLLPNFAQENMNVFRSLSNLVTDTMFSQDLTNERMMVGYDYLGQDRASKGRVTGYENTANSSYFLADTKLNNRQRFGLGVALTRFNSDYDDDSSRKATFAQAMGSYMHDFGNRWKYAGLLRVGYADGDYKRQSDSERVSGDTSDILYGFNNELRYNYDLGFMTLEPQVELNAYGYYQRKIKENDEKISALLVDGTNNLSIEAGAGLYAGKETVYGETGRVKARLGGSYYRELSQPYHTMRARVRDTDGYYLIESTDIFDRNRVIVRADITFSWKALDFYLRGSQFMEDKHTTVINAGIKFNF